MKYDNENTILDAQKLLTAKTQENCVDFISQFSLKNQGFLFFKGISLKNSGFLSSFCPTVALDLTYVSTHRPNRVADQPNTK